MRLLGSNKMPSGIWTGAVGHQVFFLGVLRRRVDKLRLETGDEVKWEAPGCTSFWICLRNAPPGIKPCPSGLELLVAGLSSPLPQYCHCIYFSFCVIQLCNATLLTMCKCLYLSFLWNVFIWSKKCFGTHGSSHVTFNCTIDVSHKYTGGCKNSP